MISKHLKIGRLGPEKSRNKFQQTQTMKKSQATFSTSCFVFVVAARDFAVKQFRIRRWKANGKTNLMISKHLKIGRLEPEKSRNTLQLTANSKNEEKPIFDFVFCFRHSGASFCRRTILNAALES